ncbi:MAG: glycoside hydrolase family 3 C-terminal domain-containing protein [Bacteroidaceae bacterium]|nr:glycoside hydrolase family 3 C-terminal domain-containing protein [Bacteroidaceae bacterium]
MKKNLFVLIGCCTLTFSMFAQPYKDPNLSAEARAKDLLGRLSLQEKAQLMEHTSPAIERLGIPAFNWWNEALHGIGRNGTATVYPITMGLAATWDDALVERAFSAASDEARAKNNIARQNGRIRQYQCLSFWTPNINIFRDPRWGRGQETYGEDPYLTTQMGLAVVRGLQGAQGNEQIEYGSKGQYRKLLACAKHFAVHSGPEYNRHSFNLELLPERDLWETYMPAFKALVQEGDVQEVMCAYHRFDGEPCCGNSRLLNDILRKDWGFKGLVTSDCWAINDFFNKSNHGTSDSKESAIATAVIAGTDVECGGTFRSLTDAVAQGKITEEKIDESLLRLLKARFELGDFDSEDLVPWKKIGPEVIANEEHHQIALDAARRSIVLLQNKQNILPLAKETKVAVIGPNANDSVMMWGNYNGFPRHTVTILEGIKQKGNVIGSMKACDLVENMGRQSRRGNEGPARDYGHDDALQVKTEDATNTTDKDVLDCVKDADVVVFVGGISPRLEGEEMRVTLPGFRGGDRTSIELPQIQRNMLKMLHDAGKKVVFVNCSGSAMALVPETTTCDAIVQAWYGGEAGGEALADVLYGDVNPTGRLPITFYRSTDQLPDYESYEMKGRTYRYMKEAPLWYFGYGLSYTTVRYGAPTYKNNVVSVSLTNTGKRQTEELVQVYINKQGDTDGPRATLRAYQRVTIPAGKTVQAEIPLPRTSFEWWNTNTNTMNVSAGTFNVMVGPSSNPTDLKSVSVTIQ